MAVTPLCIDRFGLVVLSSSFVSASRSCFSFQFEVSKTRDVAIFSTAPHSSLVSKVRARPTNNRALALSNLLYPNLFWLWSAAPPRWQFVFYIVHLLQAFVDSCSSQPARHLGLPVSFITASHTWQKHRPLRHQARPYVLST